jgi:phosphohistidine phosphatase
MAVLDSQDCSSSTINIDINNNECSKVKMDSGNSNNNVDLEYTTNEADQQEVARLKERLKSGISTTAAATTESLVPECPSHRIRSVHIDEGRHKYVQIRAYPPGSSSSSNNANQEPQIFVTSKRGAKYHVNAAEPMIQKLEEAGYRDIEVTGGGRIHLESDIKKMAIYGYSYGFGLADHAVSKEVCLKDPRYKDFDITISNDGY